MKYLVDHPPDPPHHYLVVRKPMRTILEVCTIVHHHHHLLPWGVGVSLVVTSMPFVPRKEPYRMITMMRTIVVVVVGWEMSEHLASFGIRHSSIVPFDPYNVHDDFGGWS